MYTRAEKTTQCFDNIYLTNIQESTTRFCGVYVYYAIKCSIHTYMYADRANDM